MFTITTNRILRYPFSPSLHLIPSHKTIQPQLENRMIDDHSPAGINRKKKKRNEISLKQQ